MLRAAIERLKSRGTFFLSLSSLNLYQRLQEADLLYYNKLEVHPFDAPNRPLEEPARW